MLLDLTRWLFINLMVAVGLGFLAAHPPFLPKLRNTAAYPWRDALFYCVTASFCLLFPWNGGDGIQLDLRLVVIILSGWMDGLKVAVPVAVATTLVRFAIGGAGAIPSMAIVAGGLLIATLVRRRPRTLAWLTVVALADVILLFVVIHTLVPAPPPWGAHDSPVWIQLAAITVLSFWLLNTAFDHIKETDRLREQLACELRAKAAVLELLPYGVVFLDQKQRVTGSNEAARQLCAEVVPQVLEVPGVARAFRERRRVGGLRVTAVCDGAPTQLLIAAVPLADGYVLGVENLTSVIAEEREEAQRDRLQLLGQLAATAAHEIKNPLTTIRGFLQLLEGKPELSGHRGNFGLMLGEVEHINRVVSDFLVLAGPPILQPEPIALDVVISDMLEVAAMQHPRPAVNLRLAGTSGISFQADPRPLKQILRNLLVNAYEAMPGGGELTVERQRDGDQITVTVTDTGPGIAPEILPLIFRPYVTTKATGTGLGLAISHKLALEMGGQLELSSEVGRGSTFRLTIPAA